MTDTTELTEVQETYVLRREIATRLGSIGDLAGHGEVVTLADLYDDGYEPGYIAAQLGGSVTITTVAAYARALDDLEKSAVALEEQAAFHLYLARAREEHPDWGRRALHAEARAKSNDPVARDLAVRETGVYALVGGE